MNSTGTRPFVEADAAGRARLLASRSPFRGALQFPPVSVPLAAAPELQPLSHEGRLYQPVEELGG